MLRARSFPVKILALTIACLVSNTPVANELDTLFNAELEELMQIEISVATKSKVQLHLSPSSVTVYNQSQLMEQSLFTLADLADVTPGYSSYSIYGERVFETRGQKAGSFENNKHLVLLDGIPVNHARANKAPTENEMPLTSIAQVEMLSGPASSLYGVGAFFGIANLSSDFTDSNSVSSTLTFQSAEQGKQLSASGNLHSVAGHTYVALSGFDKSASEQAVGPDFSPLNRYYDNKDGHFAYLRHTLSHGIFDGLSFGYINLNRQSGLGEHWVGDFSVPQNQLEWDTKVRFIQWPVELNDDVALNSQIVLNRSVEKGLVTTLSRTDFLQDQNQSLDFQDYRVNVDSKQFQSELSWQISKDDQLLVGASFEEKVDLGGYLDIGEDISNPKLSVTQQQSRPESAKAKFTGIYGQYVSYLPSLWDLHLTLGVRFDEGEYLDNSFSQSSPRLALVKELSDSVSVKASYGAALRSPGLKEYLLNQEKLALIADNSASPDQDQALVSDQLAAETFDSYELSINYHDKSFNGQLATFYNVTTGALNSQSFAFTDKAGRNVTNNAFTNSSEEVKTYGMDAQANWAINQSWRLSGFVSHIFDFDAGSQMDNDTGLDTPKSKAYIKASYAMEGSQVYISQRFIGYQSNQVDNIWQMQLGGHYQVTEQLRAQLAVNNLFDGNDYYLVNGQDGPPMAQRNAQLSVHFQY